MQKSYQTPTVLLVYINVSKLLQFNIIFSGRYLVSWSYLPLSVNWEVSFLQSQRWHDSVGTDYKYIWKRRSQKVGLVIWFVSKFFVNFLFFWWIRNQDNMFRLKRHVYCRLLFQWASTIKIQLRILISYKADIIIISSKCSLYLKMVIWC